MCLIRELVISRASQLWNQAPEHVAEAWKTSHNSVTGALLSPTERW
jgi:hypothetical protein